MLISKISEFNQFKNHIFRILKLKGEDQQLSITKLKIWTWKFKKRILHLQNTSCTENCQYAKWINETKRAKSWLIKIHISTRKWFKIILRIKLENFESDWSENIPSEWNKFQTEGGTNRAICIAWYEVKISLGSVDNYWSHFREVERSL